MRPLLSIVIPTLGHLKKLNYLLQSLEKQLIDFLVEVIVVDNSVQKLNTLSQHLHVISHKQFQVHLMTTKTRGVNQARNLGLKFSQAPIVLFLDDDCWIRDQGLLTKHVLLHQQNPQIFAIGGYYHLPLGKSIFDVCYHTVQMHWLQAGINPDSLRSDYLIGGHFSIKKELASGHQIEFDTDISYGGSELGFFQKAKQSGLVSVLQEIYIMHDTNENLLSLTRKLYRQGMGKSITQKKFKSDESINQRVLTSGHGTGVLNLLQSYLSISFWFGYYREQQNLLGFFRHLVKLLYGLIRQKKNSFLQWTDRLLQNKKDRGDLL